ncbi:hypothetical protein ACWEWX_27395 [Streptomyces asiaticus]
MPSALDRLNAYVTHKSDEDQAEFARRVAAYRAEVLHEGADAIEARVADDDVVVRETWAGMDAALLRRMADETGKDTPAGATELGEFVPCIKDRCQRGEWSGKAAERGWEHQAGGGWLCPQCAGKVTTEQATP